MNLVMEEDKESESEMYRELDMKRKLKEKEWMDDGGLGCNSLKLKKLNQAIAMRAGRKTIKRRSYAVLAAMELKQQHKSKKSGGAVAMDSDIYGVVMDEEALEAESELQDRYMKAVWESDGFDLEDVTVERPLDVNFFSFYSPREDSYSKFVIVYAKLGIHRYNMLQGKKLQFSSMVKYNYLDELVCYCAYYITCVAKDPDCSSLEHFQLGLMEQCLDNQIDMLVSCFIARPKSAEKPVKPVEPVEPVEPAQPVVPGNYYSALPQWPSSEKDFNDKSRYYLLKRSEVGKYDCIRLYLELAFTKANISLGSKPDLDKLVITRVAVNTGEEGEETLEERLESGNVTFFIKYKYYPKNCRFARDRIAIVRRTINKKTGVLKLLFNHHLQNTLL